MYTHTYTYIYIFFCFIVDTLSVSFTWPHPTVLSSNTSFRCLYCRNICVDQIHNHCLPLLLTVCQECVKKRIREMFQRLNEDSDDTQSIFYLDAEVGEEVEGGRYMCEGCNKMHVGLKPKYTTNLVDITLCHLCVRIYFAAERSVVADIYIHMSEQPNYLKYSEFPGRKAEELVHLIPSCKVVAANFSGFIFCICCHRKRFESEDVACICTACFITMVHRIFHHQTPGEWIINGNRRAERHNTYDEMWICRGCNKVFSEEEIGDDDGYGTMCAFCCVRLYTVFTYVKNKMAKLGDSIDRLVNPASYDNNVAASQNEDDDEEEEEEENADKEEEDNDDDKEEENDEDGEEEEEDGEEEDKDHCKRQRNN